MIARDAIHWRFDSGKNLQSFRQKLRVFDQVAREANEIRRQCIDLFHHRFRVGAIAFVMQIAELHKSMLGLVREPQMSCFYPLRLDRARIGDDRARCENARSANEFTPAEFPWLFRRHSAQAV